jgi:hypothetical protein
VFGLAFLLPLMLLVVVLVALASSIIALVL